MTHLEYHPPTDPRNHNLGTDRRMEMGEPFVSEYLSSTTWTSGLGEDVGIITDSVRAELFFLGYCKLVTCFIFCPHPKSLQIILCCFLLCHSQLSLPSLGQTFFFFAAGKARPWVSKEQPCCAKEQGIQGSTSGSIKLQQPPCFQFFPWYFCFR
jgi:hypothetical protein